VLAVGAVANLAAAAICCAASLPTLSIPYNATGIDATPLWTAFEGRLFQRYGVEALSGGVMQSPALIASMLSGETQVALVGPDAVVSADLNGGDIAILVSGTNKAQFRIYAAGSIQSVAALKGKRLGVTRFGTTTDFVARYVLQQAGLDPQRDTTIIPMGSQPAMLAALLAGGIDAAVLGPGNVLRALKTKELGDFNLIADLANYSLQYYSGSLVVRKSWAAADRAEALNVVRGYLAGVARVHRDEKATIAAMAKYSEDKDPDVLKQGYTMLVKVLPKVPVPEAAVLQTLLEHSKLAAAKHADPAQFIDVSYIEELQRDGFIARLYNGKE
jgi:NitT/TauT family transport system substrate-binding protein